MVFSVFERRAFRGKQNKKKAQRARKGGRRAAACKSSEQSRTHTNERAPSHTQTGRGQSLPFCAYYIIALHMCLSAWEWGERERESKRTRRMQTAGYLEAEPDAGGADDEDDDAAAPV